MFDNLFGTEAGPIVNYVFAFLLVIILILALAWLFRRFVARGDLHFGPRTGQRRLAVVEASGVDAQRRLILVRRDNVEHLLLIGGPSDIVVEANIGRQLRQPHPAQPQPAQVQAPRPRPVATAQPKQPPAAQAGSQTPAPRPQPVGQHRPEPAAPAAPAGEDRPPLRPRHARPGEPTLDTSPLSAPPARPAPTSSGSGKDEGPKPAPQNRDPFLRTEPLLSPERTEGNGERPEAEKQDGPKPDPLLWPERARSGTGNENG